MTIVMCCHNFTRVFAVRCCACILVYLLLFFFFQAEDGIRDYKVTGVQTCALPIFDVFVARLGVLEFRIVFLVGRLAQRELHFFESLAEVLIDRGLFVGRGQRRGGEIGRASCRERGEMEGGEGRGGGENGTEGSASR